MCWIFVKILAQQIEEIEHVIDLIVIHRTVAFFLSKESKDGTLRSPDSRGLRDSLDGR